MQVPKPKQCTRRHLVILGGSALAVALVAMPSPAHAVFYQVPNGAFDSWTADGVCSLREAIRAANLRQQVDACPPGDPSFNEIKIIGDPAARIDLRLTDQIEITSWIVISADLGPGFFQAINGNNTSFVVRKGGRLEVQFLSFRNFKVTPFFVESGVISGRGSFGACCQ